MSATPQYAAVFASPVGKLGIRMQGKALCQLVFLSARYTEREPASEAAADVLHSLRAYFDDPRQGPAVDVRLAGSQFQRRVWRALCSIPCGKIMTYGGLAACLGSSARAVGNACRSNPVPIVVPCHRVVARNGIGGFAGDRHGRLVAVKQRLLEHEGVEIGAWHPHLQSVISDEPQRHLLMS